MADVKWPYIKMCDRCATVFSVGEGGWTLSITRSVNIDLCPDCSLDARAAAKHLKLIQKELNELREQARKSAVTSTPPHDWSARCTAEHCRYGVRTGSYLNVSSRAHKHAREHSGHVVNVKQGGKVRFQAP